MIFIHMEPWKIENANLNILKEEEKQNKQEKQKADKKKTTTKKPN